MIKPESFSQDVWDKLTDKERKEIYLEEILMSENAPHYLYGAIIHAKTTLDRKIEIAEKITDGKMLSDEEKKEIDLDIAD